MLMNLLIGLPTMMSYLFLQLMLLVLVLRYMSEQYRSLGPLEAINGVLMIGVSTAVLMTTFQDAIGKTIQARQKTASLTGDV